MLKEIESISKKKNFIFLVFFLLILIQLEVGFLYPTYDSSTDYWKTIDELKSYKNYSLDSFDNSVFQKIRFLVSNYHIDGDAAAHILLAHDFPEGYLRGNLTYLDRPLYPFLVSVFAKPLHLISNSYIFTFAAGITLNTIFLFLTIVFLYLLVEKLISPRVALLSSCLLIFSPFVRVWLSQPGTNIFGIFTVIVSLYLIYVYQKNPSLSRLIIFSLAIGTLMLGKMLPAISLFILILAISFKRYREGFLFLVIHLIPLFIWYIVVTKVLTLTYLNGANTTFNLYLINGWLFNIFKLSWYKTFGIFLGGVPLFITAVVYAFLLIPTIFAFIGFQRLSLRNKELFCFWFVFSFFTMFLVMNLYAPTHAFLIFPVVYPLAVLGIDRVAEFLKKYKSSYSLIFYSVIYLFLIIVSNVNIFEIIRYNVCYRVPT